MAGEQRDMQATTITSDLETTLGALEAALTEAGHAVADLRACVPRVAALAEVVATMESAMDLARRSLGAPGAIQSLANQPAAAPPLRPVPPTEAPRPGPEPAVSASEPTPSPGGSFCLRLRVTSATGSLDLKAVDGAVNENPAVVDVALLDYDGRQAALKLWIREGENPKAARDALHESLRSRLGGEEAAEIAIDIEEQSAAA